MVHTRFGGGRQAISQPSVVRSTKASRTTQSSTLPTRTSTPASAPTRTTGSINPPQQAPSIPQGSNNPNFNFQTGQIEPPASVRLSAPTNPFQGIAGIPGGTPFVNPTLAGTLAGLSNVQQGTAPAIPQAGQPTQQGQQTLAQSVNQSINQAIAPFQEGIAASAGLSFSQRIGNTVETFTNLAQNPALMGNLAILALPGGKTIKLGVSIIGKTGLKVATSVANLKARQQIVRVGAERIPISATLARIPGFSAAMSSLSRLQPAQVSKLATNSLSIKATQATINSNIAKGVAISPKSARTIQALGAQIPPTPPGITPVSTNGKIGAAFNAVFGRKVGRVLVVAGLSLGAISLVTNWIGTYATGAWGTAEAPEPVQYPALQIVKTAEFTSNPELVQEALQSYAEIQAVLSREPSIWERLIPGLFGFNSKLLTSAIGIPLTIKILEDSLIRIEEGTTTSEIIETRQLEYVVSQAALEQTRFDNDITVANLINELAVARQLAESASRLEESAIINASRLAVLQAEHRYFLQQQQIIADQQAANVKAWEDYLKLKAKLALAGRGSNLNFGRGLF